MRKRGLNPKQERFVEEYLKDLNASAAARRAGYSLKSAHRIGQTLIAKSHIQEAVRLGKEKRSKETGIDANWVLRELEDIYKANKLDIYADGGNDAAGKPKPMKLKPMKEWPLRMQRLLKGFRKGELLFFGDPVKVLELIGKHVDVVAFRERHELTGKDGRPIETTGTIRIEFVDAGDDSNSEDV